MNDTPTTPCAGCGSLEPLDPYHFDGEHCNACVDHMIRWEAAQDGLAAAIAAWRAENGLTPDEAIRHTRELLWVGDDTLRHLLMAEA